jgi:hypothetical protein
MTGRRRSELSGETRSSAFGNHILRCTNGILGVVAILEGHRAFDAYFGSSA